MRSHGGWANWDMVLIDTCSCDDGSDAKRKERYYVECLGATLNVKIPSRCFKEYQTLYYETHKDYASNYYAMHKETLKIYMSLYYMTHKEALKQYNKSYLLNKDKLKKTII